MYPGDRVLSVNGHVCPLGMLQEINGRTDGPWESHIWSQGPIHFPMIFDSYASYSHVVQVNRDGKVPRSSECWDQHGDSVAIPSVPSFICSMLPQSLKPSHLHKLNLWHLFCLNQPGAPSQPELILQHIHTLRMWSRIQLLSDVDIPIHEIELSSIDPCGLKISVWAIVDTISTADPITRPLCCFSQ